jgi:hypothetical protein
MKNTRENLVWKDFEDAGEDGIFAANQVIVAPIEDFSSGGLRKNGCEGVGWDIEVALRLAAEGEAGGGEDGAEGGVASEDARAEVGGEGIEDDFDEAVFNGRVGSGGVEGDLAEVEVIGVLGMKDGEGDRIAMEVGEFGGHVVVVDEELVEGLGDFFRSHPGKRGGPEQGGGKEGGELGGEDG